MRDPRPGGLSLRLQLTLLYAALLVAVFLLVGAFVHTSLQRVMLAEVDRSLESAWERAIAEDLEYIDEAPTFFDPDEDARGDPPAASEPPRREVIALRILRPDGTVSSGLGPYEELSGLPAVAEGCSTVQSGGHWWRLYSRPLPGDSEGQDAIGDWMQAGRPMGEMEETLRGMRRYLLAGFPALLALACTAGFLLSARALRPLAAMTHTVAAIGGEDLSLRIGHRGSAAEIAQLAGSFDRMLDRLEGAFAGEKRFTADAAHELRTPLTALKGQIEVALAKSRTPEEYRQTLSGLLQHVDRLIQLANDLLLIARMDRAAPNPPADRVELGELLEAVMEQLDPLIQARHLEAMVRNNGEAAVRGELDQLIRLFLNLLDNAAKYTPEGGRIEVEIGREGDMARVAIRNSGPGIPAEDLPFVFDRFYRVGEDRSRQSGGAGLGLAIARQIARHHRGTIRAESDPGVRTTFTVELPADPTTGSPDP
jgi:heavy metal sensor kinase